VTPDAFRAAGRSLEGEPIPEGAWLTVDAERGAVLLGEARLAPRKPDRSLGTLLSWADAVIASRALGFRANAETAAEARAGVRNGARGVGLCRTERLVGDPDGLAILGRVAEGSGRPEARTALRRLESLLLRRYRSLVGAAGDEPVTVRLLDPTLGELDAAGARGSSVNLLRPELCAAQVRALARAAFAVGAGGGAPAIEGLIPMVRTEGEAEALARLVRETASSAAARRGVTLGCRVGAMVETPRAALTAGALARHVDFLCFGTNDLTALTWGLARESAGRVLGPYRERGLLSEDPFRTLDEAVGFLVRIAVVRAREANPSIAIGVCGEHAGDPESIARLIGAQGNPGIDYFSCSPARLPGARAALARAVLGAGRGGFLTPQSARWYSLRTPRGA
jgi:pyruvate, orthophosphate dikinase